MPEGRSRQRRRHDAELKRRVLTECDAPGASVARVALAHGLNANLVHKWRRLTQGSVSTAATGPNQAQFIPLTLPTPAERQLDVRVELRRGPMTITVTWPVTAATELGTWMRELLR